MIDEDWDRVLATCLPRVALANDRDDWQREMMAFIARVHDTHANLWSSLDVRPPAGKCRLPYNIRFIDSLAVITGYAGAEGGHEAGLKPGDIIEALDGVPLAKLVEKWAPYYAASNEPTRLRDIAADMTRGNCVEAAVRIRRDSQVFELKARRLPAMRLAGTHDLPGPAFNKLSDEVAYLKLSTAQASEARSHIERAAATKGLIIDIRNSTPEFMVFALGSLLVAKPTAFARSTKGDLSNPGAFYWTKPLLLKPGDVHYEGKVVVLVDELTQSRAEYTSMAFRASPRAMVVGSTTAGADGNVSAIPLPGGLRSMISGIGVFYPDKRPTQRVGIIPDVEVKPTIAGIREGRDEVLEEALRQILGPDTPQAVIEKMSRR